MADVAGHGILVLAEQVDGRLSTISFELLGLGRRLADAAGEPLLALLFGSKVQSGDLLAAGADRVWLVAVPHSETYLQETTLPMVQQVVEQVQPRAMLLGHTSTGRDLAPGLAVRLDVGLVTDVSGVAYDSDERVLVASKPVFGGLALAELVPEGHPQLITVRPKTQEPAPLAGLSRLGDVVSIEPRVPTTAPRTRLIERVAERSRAKRLEDAEIVVSGGRGLGGPQGFRYLEDLAEVVDGVVGASRVAVDSGWVPSAMQVGLTGKITNPKLYIAVGISGAMQHMAGCSTARTLVAINSDPDAAIFETAHFGIVGDFRKVLPPLTEAFRELRGSNG